MPTAKIIETQQVIRPDPETGSRVVKTTVRTVPDPVPVGETPGQYNTKKAIFLTYQVLFYILGIIEILLVFRFILKLLGASTFSPFTYFIYTISGPFADPFLGIIRSSVSGPSVLEWSTLIAMAVYAVFVWLIVGFFRLMKPVNPEEVENTVDNP
jgi:hypothetical protein